MSCWRGIVSFWRGIVSRAPVKFLHIYTFYKINFGHIYIFSKKVFRLSPRNLIQSEDFVNVPLYAVNVLKLKTDLKSNLVHKKYRVCNDKE
jgi:hypothetical protein